MSNMNDSSVRHVRAKTLTLHWHEGAAAIYTVGTQPMKAGERSMRLVTGGGDNNIRIWKVDYNKEGTEVEGVEYLSSITKHTQAVNCVRFNRIGDLLATASDDGTIMIWQINDTIVREFGQDADEDIKESWVLKIACFASNMSEIYDICWSPDSKYICCGLMDNIIRIFSVATGSMVKQIAEHSHYVQGVAWDPRGDYICSQSADRSVHVYKVSNNENGELVVGPTAFYKSIKSEVPALKLSQLTSENLSKSSNNNNSQERILCDVPITASNTRASTPTPTSTPTPISSTTSSSNSVIHTPIISSVNVSNLNSSFNNISSMSKQPSNTSKTMEPPLQAPRHKRTHSNSSTSSSHSVVNRCLSPLPLPAVMPSSPSHLHLGLATMLSPTLPNATLVIPTSNNNYNNINNNLNIPTSIPTPSVTDVSNASTPAPSTTTTAVSYKQHYLYHNETLQSFFRRLTFSPDGSMLITTCGIYKPNTENGKEEIQNTVYVYTRAGLNKGPVVHLPGLRKPAIVVRFSPVRYSLLDHKDDKGKDVNVFSLKYRMLFAIATQDSILIYDTQQLKCVAIVTSIHYAVITDVAWSSDGRTVFVSSNDGFISCVVLGDDIVGEIVGGFDNKELEELFKEEEVAIPQTPIHAPTLVTIPTVTITTPVDAHTSVTVPVTPTPKAAELPPPRPQPVSSGVKRDVLEMLTKKDGGEGNEAHKEKEGGNDSKRSCV